MNNIIKYLKSKTDTVILFSSGTGKDSIMLTDICSKEFHKVHIIYMYLVKNLLHVDKYLDYFKQKYSNIEIEKIPSWVLTSYIKYGKRGIKKDEKQKLLKLSDIDRIIKNNTGIDWSIYGFKKSDGLTRRIQLMQYETIGICEKTKKCYPLSEFTNKQVLFYISENNLIEPIKYNPNIPSQSQDINDPFYLSWIKKYYPEDYLETLKFFPLCKQLVFEHEKRNLQTV